MEVFECVSFLLVKNGQMLLEKRSAAKTHDPNIVAIPGGHIELGENQTDALLRELDEELAVSPQKSVYLCSLYHPTGELQLLHYYVIPQWSGDIACHEADEVFWRILIQMPSKLTPTSWRLWNISACMPVACLAKPSARHSIKIG